MKKISQLLIIFILGSPFITQAQRKNNWSDLITHTEGSTWYKINAVLDINSQNINSFSAKEYFGFDQNNNFLSVKSEQDELGFQHTRYQQVYDNIPVEFAQIIVHQKGQQTEFNGKFVPNFKRTEQPVLNFQQALAKAKTYLPATKYRWEDPQEELAYKRRSFDLTRTYFPKESLVWCTPAHKENDRTVANYRLAYKMSIFALAPDFSKEIYIDAITGAQIKLYELEYTCGSHSFTSNFNGTRTVNYDDTGTQHTLVDFCGNGDAVYVSNNSNFYTPYSKNSSAAWPVTDDFNSACTSLWAIQRAEEYYKLVHLRNGFDNSILNVDLRHNAAFWDAGSSSYYYANASFNPTGICKVGNHQSSGPFGPNDHVGDDWNCVDIMAHEMTHGVTASTAALVYAGESGALNESFSDIFGVNVVAYTNFLSILTNSIWQVGYDRTDTAGKHDSIRDMANPTTMGDPHTYLTSPQWYDPAGTWDGGGVHRNSGVQNKMYHLLVKGGAGTNANGLVYNVTGITIADARAIAYRALTANYLTTNALHPEARDAWVHAAVDLFGFCSTQAVAVGKAWEAVGVGSYIYLSNPLCGTQGNGWININQSGSPYQVSANNCGFTILPTGNLVLISGNQAVDVYPGFNATVGANAQIIADNNCHYSNY